MVKRDVETAHWQVIRKAHDRLNQVVAQEPLRLYVQDSAMKQELKLQSLDGHARIARLIRAGQRNSATGGIPLWSVGMRSRSA
jgi:hypothetical protein